MVRTQLQLYCFERNKRFMVWSVKFTFKLVPSVKDSSRITYAVHFLQRCVKKICKCTKPLIVAIICTIHTNIIRKYVLHCIRRITVITETLFSLFRFPLSITSLFLYIFKLLFSCPLFTHPYVTVDKTVRRSLKMPCLITVFPAGFT